jgi:hypothetical protein
MAIGYLPLAAAILLTPELKNYSAPDPDAESALAVRPDEPRKARGGGCDELSEFHGSES